MKKLNNEKLEEAQNTKEETSVEPYQFSPDNSMKKLFMVMKSERLIPILNYFFDKKYDLDTEVYFKTTEGFVAQGSLDKKKVISDLALKTKKDNPLGIEFQSTEDKEMPDRLFLYAINNSKLKGGIRTIPEGAVIYTTLNDRPAIGEELEQLRIKKFSVGQNNYTIDDILCIPYKYINLLGLNFADFKDSPFEILKILYLYRYRKNLKLILNHKELNEIVSECVHYIETLKGEPEEIVLQEIMYNIIYDIRNDCKKKVIYEKEEKIMGEILLTPADILKNEAKEEGKEKGINETKKQNAIALLDILDDKTIANKIGLEIGEVIELRKQNGSR